MKKEQQLEKSADSFVLMVKFKEDEKLEEAGIKGIKPEIKGIEEIETALDSTGFWFYITESEFYDRVTVELDVNPTEAITQLRKTSTIAIERAVPLDYVVSSSMESLITNILKLASQKIEGNESFTVQIELKGDGLRPIEGTNPQHELTNQLTTELCDGLNLKHQDENNDWIIQIEELGDEMGIAICRPDEILVK